MALIILKYIRKNWLFAAVIAYMVVTSILKLLTGFNITIPCLYTTLFDVHCPGCGLTSAFICLLKLDPVCAWNMNPLIFFVIPFALLLITIDFLRFKKRNAVSST